MTESLSTGMPIRREWREVSNDIINSRIPKTEDILRYERWEGIVEPGIMLLLIHREIIANAYALQYFFRQGRYSREDYAKIRGGIIETYHLLKKVNMQQPYSADSLEDLYGVAEIACELPDGYIGFTAEPNSK